MKKMLLGQAFLSIFNLASADTLTDVTIAEITVNKSGWAVIEFSEVFDFSCGSSHIESYKDSLVFDLSTPGGQGALSVALSAKMAGNKVTAMGSGICSLAGGEIEDGNYIKLQ